MDDNNNDVCTCGLRHRYGFRTLEEEVGRYIGTGRRKAGMSDARAGWR